MSMFGEFKNTTEDKKKYAEWVPKIEAYRQALENGISKEFEMKKEFIPSDLDSGIDVTKIPEKVLSKSEFEITETNGVDLNRKIAKGELTAVEVFKAFAKRAVVAHRLTNCAMEFFLDEGLQRAKELDEYYLKEGKTVGPLHGIPVSLKEHYNYKGKVVHAGTVGYLDNVADNWCTAVEFLKDAGAVFYVRTSEPQSLMHLCSENNITGRTRNPRNTSLTPGGSSSGEGAIAAMKGSIFGLGSDIGGSIRCPAAFCGVWGLRPTQKRIPLGNVFTNFKDKVAESVVPVLGPLARSPDDIELFMKSIIDLKPWKKDPSTIPMPWRDVETPDLKSLKIGIVYDDGVVKPTPPMIRGLKNAAEKLKEKGATVVEVNLPDVEKIVRACVTMYNADGNEAQKSGLEISGEPLAPLTKVTLSFGCGDKGVSVSELETLNGIREEGRAAYNNILNEKDLDFILSPPYVSVAGKPATIKYWGYTNLWNILDFPNVVFPTGLTVDADLDKVDKSFKPRNETEEYEYTLYTGPEDFKDAPINLQLTGRRYNDEEVLKASKVIATTVQE